MKYNDRNTLNSWNKQVDKLDQEDSDRKLRRKNERDLNNFSKSICLIVDKDWWDCVSKEQKQMVFHKWQNTSYYQRNMGFNKSIKFEDWVKEIRETTPIDISLYRDKQLQRILD